MFPVGTQGVQVIDIRWNKGLDYNADAFTKTKNLDCPAFEKCIKTLVLVGQDVHMKLPTPLSKEGVGRDSKVLRRVSGIPDLIKEGLHFANLLYIFE